MKQVVGGLFPKRTVFDLTHDRKTTFDMGSLIPVLLEECIPGDTWQIKAAAVVRMAPMLGVVMHRYNVFLHYFFVPHRLTQTAFPEWIAGKQDGTADTETWPYFTFDNTSAVIGGLHDHFGLPVLATGWAVGGGTLTCDAKPFRAYNLIYNEWYRDEWLQPEITISKAGGQDVTTASGLLTRNWEKDYFTSCLPNPQKGTAINLSIGGTAPVVIDNTDDQLTPGIWWDTGGGVMAFSPNYNAGAAAVLNLQWPHATLPLRGADAPDVGTPTDVSIEGTADLSQATGMDVGTFRTGMQTQKWLERNARAGNRLRESLQAHFGVVAPDFRLQRPELIGAAKAPVAINEVVQVSAGAASSPQGNMTGHGLAVTATPGMRYSVVEHGYVIGIMSIMPKTAYQQGLEKLWTRDSRFKHYWPEFAHLSEQPVYKREVYCVGGGAANDTQIFGYRGIYDEYRSRNSVVTGDFRDTMDFWHSARIFGGVQALNSSFLTCIPDKRIYSAENPTDYSCWVHLLHDVKVLRPMPRVADPGLVDHF